MSIFSSFFACYWIYRCKIHTTTVDTNSDISVGETLFTQEKDNFIDLELQDLGFEEFDGGTVDTDETMTTLAVSNSSGGFLWYSVSIHSVPIQMCMSSSKYL
jgi:hypothetical protein